VTVFDKSARKDRTFSREDFSYDQAHDVYVCPGGRALTTTGTRVNDGDTSLHRASKADCDACDQMVPMTSSSSQQLPRTFANWPN
jgi:hypothetical protein